MTSKKNTVVYRKKPAGFSPVVEIVGLYLKHDGRYLFLQRAENKPQGLTWGVPAGKRENDETSVDAIIRETKEETGIDLNKEPPQEIGPLFVRHNDLDFLYRIFHLEIKSQPSVCLSDEHIAYAWVKKEEALSLDLIGGGADALQHYEALIASPFIKRKPFYFVRHGETAINASPTKRRVDYDLPLNQRGRQQAANLRQLISTLSLNSVSFSPILRAKETKEIIMQGHSLIEQELSDLRECKAVEWEEMTAQEMGYGFTVSDPLKAYFSRIVTGINTALTIEGEPLIVAHGGIHYGLCYLLMIDEHPWNIGNCELIYFTPTGTNEWKAKRCIGKAANE